jgi:hypothetical protein
MSDWQLVPKNPTVGMFAELTRSIKESSEAGMLFCAQWSLGRFVDDYRAMLAAAPTPPAEAAGWPDFSDANVQTVYEILCDTQSPPEGEHWEGFAARRIVAALLARPPAEAKPVADELDQIDVAAEAYQVVGALADFAGVFEHPEVVRALDFLAYEDKRAEPLTPWPRTALAPPPADALAERRAVVAWLRDNEWWDSYVGGGTSLLTRNERAILADMIERAAHLTDSTKEPEHG